MPPSKLVKSPEPGRKPRALRVCPSRGALDSLERQMLLNGRRFAQGLQLLDITCHMHRPHVLDAHESTTVSLNTSLGCVLN